MKKRVSGPIHNEPHVTLTADGKVPRQRPQDLTQVVLDRCFFCRLQSESPGFVFINIRHQRKGGLTYLYRVTAFNGKVI